MNKQYVSTGHSPPPAVSELNPVTRVEDAGLRPGVAADGGAGRCFSHRSCPALCSPSPLLRRSPRVPGRQPSEAASRKHLAGQRFLQSFVPTITLYFFLSLSLSLSCLDFMQANWYFFLNSWEHQMEGEGEGEAQGKAGRGWAGSVDEEEMFWNMGSWENAGQVSRGRKGKKSWESEQPPYVWCTDMQGFQHTIKIEKETFWFP